MVRACPHVPSLGVFVLMIVATAFSPGCGIVPRSRMDECQKLSQLLRSENARLKDQVLALQSENRDYADRAVDDLRRLTVRDQAIERLEQSVQAYQDDRERLAASYEQLVVSLGGPTEPNHTRAGLKPSEQDTRRRVGGSLSEVDHPNRKGVTATG